MPTKVHIIKAMIFPVVMYECESWTIKKVEDWRNDFFKNFIIYLFIFYFTILYWFCHTLTWIHHGCTWVPNPDPRFHALPYIISLGHPSAPASSILYPVSNLDWRFVSYMIVYTFQCHSPKSSHPLPLPQSPKVCFYICVSFAVSHTGLSLPSF